MQEIIAPVSDIKFDIEIAIEQQIGSLPLPFPGMDKSGAAICTFYVTSMCSKGAACPYRHVKGDRSIVCKHWLRGLCKKGDDCEFLHEYDMSKMPECYFFSRFGQCSNKDCPFLHIDPENKIKDCPWYDRGFCRHGPLCKNRHVRRVICQCYLNGFCLDGPNCKYVHKCKDETKLDRMIDIIKTFPVITCMRMPLNHNGPRSKVKSDDNVWMCSPSFDIPAPDPQQQAKKLAIVCHTCGQAGHKAAYCPSTTGQPLATTNLPVATANETSMVIPEMREERTSRRPLDQVTCYKCGEKGHYANKCPKGHLAFLSPSVGNVNMGHPANNATGV